VSALGPTFSVTDPDLAQAVDRQLGEANRLAISDALLTTTDLRTYAAPDRGWLATPPPRVAVNGLPTVAGQVDLAAGTVTFPTALSPQDVVTASYTYAPLSLGDLSSCCQEALAALEGHLGVDFDPTAVPRACREALLTQAYLIALRTLMTRAAEYYRWRVGDREVDRRRTVQQYSDLVIRVQQMYERELSILRARFAVDGGKVNAPPPSWRHGRWWP
jgi:hypothetical protein